MLLTTRGDVALGDVVLCDVALCDVAFGDVALGGLERKVFNSSIGSFDPDIFSSLATFPFTLAIGGGVLDEVLESELDGDFGRGILVA